MGIVLKCSFELYFFINSSFPLLLGIHIFSITVWMMLMDYGKFLEFISFSSFMISMNFPNQLVTDMSDPVLKS